MPVEDVFTTKLTCNTGLTKVGVLKKLTSTITGVEMFRKILDRGEAGDNVGLLLRGIDKESSKEEWLSLPGSVTTRYF
jgi:elongation factor Tu